MSLYPDEQKLMNSNGQVKIWNYETQTDLKTFEVTDVPVRCVRYIARKNWVRLLLFTPPSPQEGTGNGADN
jgi:hypothetical protein